MSAGAGADAAGARLRSGLRAYGACSAATAALAAAAACGALRGRPTHRDQPALQPPLHLWALLNAAVWLWVSAAVWLVRRALGRVTPREARRARDALGSFAVQRSALVLGALGAVGGPELLLWALWLAALAACSLMQVLAIARMEQQEVRDEGGGALAGPAVLGAVAAGGSALLLAGTVAAPQLAALAGLAAAPSADTDAAAAGAGSPQLSLTLTIMTAECVVVLLWGLHVWARGVWGSDYGTGTGGVGFDTVGCVVECCLVAGLCCAVPSLSPPLSPSLSLGPLALLLRLRAPLGQLLQQLGHSSRRRRLLAQLQHSCPLASPEEVKQHGDKCAICWEPLTAARRLPCNHLFHSVCLCRWAEQHASCPTCRRGLAALPSLPPLAPLAPRPAANHLFYFDGSRYVSWLPSFSVEVTRTRAYSLSPPEAPDHMAGQMVSLVGWVPSAPVPAPHPMPSHSAMSPPPPPASASAPTPRHIALGSPAPEDDLPVEEAGPSEFSPLPAERESQLQRRKRALVAAARRRYLARHS